VLDKFIEPEGLVYTVSAENKLHKMLTFKFIFPL